MSKHPLQFTRLIALMLVTVFLTNLGCVYATATISSSEKSLAIQNSNDEFSPYIGVNCTKMGEYDSIYGSPIDMCLVNQSSRTFAFILENNGILILDITILEEPVFLAQILIDELIFDMCVYGNYLYVSYEWYGLLTYSIENINEPVLLLDTYYGGVSAPNYNFISLYVSNDILFASDSYQGLILLDLSDPLDPQYISRYYDGDFLPYYRGFILHDNLGFICHDNSLRIVDFTDIHSPFLTGIFTASDNTEFMSVVLDDNKAYICTDDGRFYILDISDTTNPTQIGHIWDESVEFVGFHPDNSIGYLLSDSKGLFVLNSTNIQNMNYLYHEKTSGRYTHLTFHKSHLLLLDNREGLEIYTIEQDHSVALKSRFLDGGLGLSVTVSGKFAYVVNYYQGLEIYKIGNDFTPVLLSTLNLGVSCFKVFVNKNIAYVLSANDNIYTIDISNKKKPKLLRYHSLIIDVDNQTLVPWVWTVELFSDIVYAPYIGLGSYYLAIFDLTKEPGSHLLEIRKTNSRISAFFADSYYLYLIDNNNYLNITSIEIDAWEVLGSIQIEYLGLGLFVSENYAYIGTTDDLTICDISDLSALEIVSSFHSSMYSWIGHREIYVESEIVYLIAESNDYLHCVNVQNKSHLYLEGTFNCNDTLWGLCVQDQVVYLTSFDVNLEIVQLDRFISIVNRLYYISFAGLPIVIGVPILIFFVVRNRRKRPKIDSRSITEILPREEINEPGQESEV